MTQPASPSTPSGPAAISTNEGDRSRATKTRQVHPLPTPGRRHRGPRHIDYIHFKPVKHGLVTRVCDRPHCSFKHYVARGDLLLACGGDLGKWRVTLASDRTRGNGAKSAPLPTLRLLQPHALEAQSKWPRGTIDIRKTLSDCLRRISCACSNQRATHTYVPPPMLCHRTPSLPAEGCKSARSNEIKPACVRIGKTESPFLQRYDEHVGGLRYRNVERPHDRPIHQEMLEFRDELLPCNIVHWHSV